jgi:hypothetical protein
MARQFEFSVLADYQQFFLLDDERSLRHTHLVAI